MRELVVLSGGGSPYSDTYRPVYQIIANQAQIRAVPYTLVDYIGCGHDDCSGCDPKWGKGSNLPSAVERTRAILRNVAPGSTLFCRSFGCDVCMRLATQEPELIYRLDSIILWGPSPYHYYWQYVGADAGAIEKFNAEVSAKGLKLSADFWRTFVPIEVSAKKFSGKRLTIAYGTEDPDCDAAFVNYLSSIVKQSRPGVPVEVISIAGAGHELTADSDAVMLAQYLALIFRYLGF